ncbi:phage tail tape measure protein [Levilactobacillus brevis]|uniref:phage tail tape measure protein n=1 Tax=Levilactobacillus brevis TaxID=1580 RepID=UPI0021A39F51|nr:phage tail tape measure protein [Levilactobacillus brevis]MCT3567630.1 phage tail tape measure protein [Levilactobacillus brevis]
MASIAGDRINYKIDIDGLSGLAGMQRTIQQVNKLMPHLGKSIDGVTGSIKKMNQETANSRVTDSLNRQKRRFDDVADAAGKMGQQVDRTRQKTTALGSTMQRSMNKPYFKKQTHDLSALGSKMQSFGTKALAVTGAVTAGAAIALKTATNLQNRYKVLSNLAVTGGERQAEVTKNVAAMQKDGTKYSDAYGVSTKKIGEGYETLIRRGYTTNQALGSQKSYLQGAIASGDSYSDVVNNAASAIEQFGMKVNSVKGMAAASKTAINQMAYSADLTATSFGNLGEALKFSGPDAHAAHQSLHTTVAAIGDISNFGIDGSQAGTSMRQIYQRLVNPPSKGKAPDAMKKLGLSYSDFRDSKKELLPIQDIFGKLATKMDKMKMSQTDKGAIYAALFGVNASSAAQALGTSYKQVDALDKKVQKSQNMNHGKGYVAELSEKNLNTFQNQWNRFKQGLLNSGVNIANAWMPSLTKITKALADMLEGFQALPEPAKKFISLGVGLAAVVGPLALLAGSLLKIHGALTSLTKLGGGSKGKLGIADQVAGFLGVGQGKNNPKNFSDRSGTTHFSKRARVPGSLVANGVDWTGMRQSRRTVHATTRKVVSNVSPGRTLLSRMDTAKSGIASGASWVGGKAKGGWNLAKSGANFVKNSRLGSVAKFGGKVAKLGGKVASRVPVLDVAMAGTNLIGMNKKNAGKKVGSAGGMLAGGAIGSMLGPLGGMAGAAIGQALGTKLGATIQKSLPKKFKKSIGSAVSSIKKTFSGLLSPFKTTVKSITKVWGSATKGISKAWNRYVVKPLSGKNGSAAIKDTLKIFKVILVPTMKIAGTAFKVFGAVVKTTIKVVADILEGLIKTVSGSFALVSDLIHGRWKDAWKDAKQIFSGIFGTIGNVFKDIIKSIWDGLVSFGKSVGVFMKHPIKSVEGWFGGGKSSKGSSKAKGHAAGGLMSTSHMALVGEAGPEMAYHPGQGYMRWLGKNGPTLARVKPGERILNAKDSANVAAGGLGRGMTLPGYASGTAKLVKGKKNKGSVSLKFDAYGTSSKTSLKSLNKLQKGSKKSWRTLQKDSTNSVKLLSKTNLKEFTGIQKDTGKRTDTIRKNTVSDFDTMQKGSMVQMNQLHKGMNSVTQAMVSDFDKIFGKLSGYAHKEMAAAIKQLNGGIGGINTVLNKFGGGGSVLPLIHYAQGSKGPISKHTMAVVNDAKVGPRQEAIVKPNGCAYLPKGNDVVLPLAPGDEVLNGTETAQLQDVGALPHFAKGTGALRRLIKNSDKDPKKAWRRDFTSNLKDEKSNSLGKGLMATSKGAAKHVGVPWNTEAWAQLKDAMSGGAGAGGNWAHSPGLTKEDGFGTSRAQYYGAGAAHDGVDFSGPLGSVIRAIHGGTVSRIGGVGISDLGKVIIVKSDDGFQEIYQEFGGMGNIKVGVGDTIKTGQRIATLGKLVGTGSGSHVHIGVTKGNPLKKNMLSTSGWYDVTKMHGKSSGISKAKNKSKNPALTKLVKSELGHRLKWVSKNLSEEDVGNLSLSGSLAKRVNALAAAIKKMYPAATENGIAAVLGNWNFESGGLNTGAVNSGGGASGLGQWLGGRKTNLMNFARKHGKSWKDAGVQLAFALRGEGSDSALLRSVLRGKGSVASLAAKFSSQWERGGYTAEHVAGARKVEAALHANGGWAKNGKVNIFGEVKGQNEVAINTSRPSADRFLLEAMSDRANKAPNSMFGQLRTFAKMQHEFAKMKESQTKFSKQSVSTTQPSKGGMVLRPQITYSPKYVIQAVSDPEAVCKTIAKQETKGQRDFEAKMNNLAAKLMSAE